jgi:hypothetical protein
MDISKIQKQIYNRTYQEKVKKETELKKKQLDYGLACETEAIPILNIYFKDNLVKTNQFCCYDFTGINSGYLYELKSNMYSIHKYRNVVIDKQKITSYGIIPNLIIVFSFIESNNITDYYFIKYNNSLFDTFNVREIHLARGYVNKIIDINPLLLMKIDIDNPIDITGQIIKIPIIPI